MFYTLFIATIATGVERAPRGLGNTVTVVSEHQLEQQLPGIGNLIQVFQPRKA
jgi:hypothetical protein